MTISKLSATSATRFATCLIAGFAGVALAPSLLAQDSGTRKPPPPTEVVARPSGPGAEFLAAYRQAGRPTLEKPFDTRRFRRLVNELVERSQKD